MGLWEEIVDYTVPSNTTQVDFTGLNITKDDFIRVVMTHNSTGTEIGLFANGNTTTTNYYMQFLVGDGTSVNALRINKNQIDFTPSGSSDVINCYLKLSENDKLNIFALNSRTADADVRIQWHYTTSISSFSSISELNFVPTTGSSIGANSRIQIYRLTAEKVADITVASNTTQVDITGLNIDKSSEYLLVNDISNGADGADYFIYPNDLNTITNYYHQYITASDSSASSERQNKPTFAFTNDSTNSNSVSYTHIKISNIGAFTYQSYELRGIGSSNLRLINYFGSSTYENLNNITKLTLDCDETNGYGTSSRFQLYKLY